jgi:DAK2 domain fusion protein YloV
VRVQSKVSDPALSRFRAVVGRALAHLEARRQEVNDLNVFPVADGDTGDNMVLTLRAVVDELDRLSAGRTIDEVGRDEIVESVARAALLGARGNSGVILSQLIRGAAEELASRPGELVDPVLISAAMARAAARAYDSVREPAEGTILTVVREMSLRIASEVAHMDEPRLGPDATAPEQDARIAAVLEAALEEGKQSVQRGPEHLDVLRESGVVDAGGYAATVLIAGVIAALKGTDAPEVAHERAPARVTHPEHDSSTYRYCTNFAVTGTNLDATWARHELEKIGDSVLAVGDSATLKVHVHTDEPERATALFDGIGTVSRLDVADMHEQIVERQERLQEPAAKVPVGTCSGLAVVSGEGTKALFEELGLVGLDGGVTLNPSTYELLAGIHEVGAEQVVLLPNSPNVRMAAERAAELSEKKVVVVPTRSEQTGLAAAIAFDPNRTAAENAEAMNETLARIRSGAVAPAARDDAQGRFVKGDAVGFVDEELIAWGDPESTLRTVLERLGSDAELISGIAGPEAPLAEDAVTALVSDGVELELADGAPPSYWWLLAAE